VQILTYPSQSNDKPCQAVLEAKRSRPDRLIGWIDDLINQYNQMVFDTEIPDGKLMAREWIANG
jgi:hypothetical protein